MSPIPQLSFLASVFSMLSPASGNREACVQLWTCSSGDVLARHRNCVSKSVFT